MMLSPQCVMDVSGVHWPSVSMCLCHGVQHVTVM